MELSIIIVSWRVKELLKQCLESIFLQTQNLIFEVIVIDNDSGDGTVEMVEENFPQVKLIKSQINLGFARACNLGIKKSTGKNVLLLNPDTKLIDNSLMIANQIVEADESIGILGCKLLNFDMSIQQSVRSFPRLWDHLIMIFKLHHLFKLKKYLTLNFDYKKTAEVEQVMGAFFLISKLALQKVGCLDEKYYIWFEEVDYCQRVKKASFKVIYSPEAQIIHYGGMSFKQAENFKNQRLFSQSRLRYILKHQGIITYLLILIFTPISLLLSLIAQISPVAQIKNANIRR